MLEPLPARCAQARRLVAAVAQHRKPAFPGDLQVLVTPDAGHYPAIDQPGSVLHQVRLRAAGARIEQSIEAPACSSAEPACWTPPNAPRPAVQLADACSYLPAAAREAMLAEARRQPFHGAVQSDSAAALQEELKQNPLGAAAHEASEL